MSARHFVPISGGKDSLATALVARERAERKPGFEVTYQTADTMNEHEVWLEYLHYLEGALGAPIQRVSAYDVPGLIDDGAFARRRQSIRDGWPHELRRKRHSAECKARRDSLPAAVSRCRPSIERVAALREHARLCEDHCPTMISPPVSSARIEQAVAAMYSTGNAFLDICMIHGRFPSKQAKFCTEEAKLLPLFTARNAMLADGEIAVDWVGERAQESLARAKKPVIERTITREGQRRVIYRPIHSWTHHEVFDIAKRHGVKPNPLYLIGAKRVGCWPCINSSKGEIALIARHTPERIDLIRDWEWRVSMVSRRWIEGNGRASTFFHSKTLPMSDQDQPDDRANIDAVVDWARTSQGGHNFSLLSAIADDEYRTDGASCVSAYGLCE
ncbi:phosphoadenosine phosphosulfate reductase domain-containing protein [Sphingomonas sp. Leaf30]|uniref:phosphoadenosine phosphosulfate reductase domain-containing protein n=1 Tax=Sphingomonas sp. Leaf30 TaxID=1736213 RepID=UPI0009E75F46|nr:phosphoadenosine phosphosulfate reductase family protein [Sphingomonas sp. Leaf30]